MRGKKQDKFKTEVLVMTKRLFVPTVEYDENYDNCQEQEDDWVSSVIGTESDAVYDVLSNL
jgi:hypothetical protein|tara:strand:- start:15 stop:197 length:183 start_codon:yes stop_codon:yes gene_type:complete